MRHPSERPNGECRSAERGGDSIAVVACLVIPVYNHGGAIRRTVERLDAFALPIYVTDDGSDRDTEQALREVAADYPRVRLARLQTNQGKGAAVMEAFRRAYRDGCTHALQIDADGQHDPGDVPRFLELARSDPQAVVSGVPIYDDSVPAARLYGRYLTHFWVWLETLSFAVGDALCGYRLYPLGPTIRLMDRVELCRRMDFDPDVIVRLVWAGTPVRNLRTRVTYPAGGISHFDALRDNLRISRMHARLFFGMLPRAPRLLARRFVARGKRGEAHWSRIPERGAAAGLRAIYWAYRLLGRRVARVLLCPVTAYFFCTAAAAREASRRYLERLYSHCGPLPSLPARPGRRETYRHFRSFADAGLDKLAAWFGGTGAVAVDFPGSVDLERVIASGRGAVLIGAHLGNFEMSRAVASGRGVRGINAVIHADNARRFTSILRDANPAFADNLIAVKDFGPETSIALQERIDRGELLFVVGDRTPVADNGRTCTVPFLGAPAAFAQGPFVLAHLLRCPVYLFFCIRVGERYRIFMEPFAERIVLARGGREEALRGYVTHFAQRLEHYCRVAPLQWFNFFDFWRPRQPAALPVTAGARRPVRRPNPAQRHDDAAPGARIVRARRRRPRRSTSE